MPMYENFSFFIHTFVIVYVRYKEFDAVILYVGKHQKSICSNRNVKNQQ